MRKIVYSFFTLLTFSTISVAQTNTFPSAGSVGIGTTTPNTSSLLEIQSTNKGVLIPRMSKVQRDAIASPASGLLIYQTNSTPGFYYFNGSAWTPISVKGANAALSNLAATTQINSSLLPRTDNDIDLGSSAFRWRNVYGANLSLSGDAIINGVTVGQGSGAQFTNTVFGNSALPVNISGGSNTVYGLRTMNSNTTGNYNTAVGAEALYSTISSMGNTATGTASLHDNTGFFNTANGYLTLFLNSTGDFNTAQGYRALYSNLTGSYNSALGYNADVASDNLTNATAIGYNALVNASNKVVVGNTTVTVIGGQVGWSKFSDGRFKANIQANVPGLEFINKLKPVTYTLQLKKLDQFLGKKDSLIQTMAKEYARGEKKLHTGFIAQEVEQAAKQINYEFDGINHPQSDKDNYSVVYADFVPSLVKAVQQLSKEKDDLKQQLSDQQSQIDELKALITGQSKATGNNRQPVNLSAVTLLQNVPNPVSHNTTISYIIPQQYVSAKLIITDKSGKTLKQVTLTATKGSVQVDVSTLAAGTYQYTLYADNKQIASKSMIVTK